ncbi:MAG: hypothetical protein ACFE8B_07780 [Candidatus Hermodarchaeota archaeon]
MNVANDEIKKFADKEFRKKILISSIILCLGFGQLGLVIGSRSWLIWRHTETPLLTGTDEITIPPSVLLPNRYLITVKFYIPTLWTEDLVGNITFTNQKSGKNYTYTYRLSGYMTYKYVVTDAKSLSMPSGKYFVSWVNNLNDYSYDLTTHGLFNFFPKDDTYPYLAENVMLFGSIMILIILAIVASHKFLRARRDHVYFK